MNGRRICKTWISDKEVHAFCCFLFLVCNISWAGSLWTLVTRNFRPDKTQLCRSQLYVSKECLSIISRDWTHFVLTFGSLLPCRLQYYNRLLTYLGPFKLGYTANTVAVYLIDWLILLMKSLGTIILYRLTIACLA